MAETHGLRLSFNLNGAFMLFLAFTLGSFGQTGTWSVVTSRQYNTLNSVTFGGCVSVPGNSCIYGAIYTAVGANGVILTSSGWWGVGGEWKIQNSGTTDTLWSVASGGTGFAGVWQFVAVGNKGVILTSPDGVTWTKSVSGTSERLYMVCWGKNNYVAFGTATGNDTNQCQVLTSPNAVTWTAVKNPPTCRLNSVAYGDSQFVAVGKSGTIFSSPDGAAWTLRMGTRCHLNSVAFSFSSRLRYRSSCFAAVGNDSLTDTSCLFLSNNGTTWTMTKPGLAGRFNSIAYGYGGFVACGDSSRVLSTAGICQYSRAPYINRNANPGQPFDLLSVAYGSPVSDIPGGFVAVGRGGMSMNVIADNLGVAHMPADIHLSSPGIHSAGKCILVTLPNRNAAGQFRVEFFTLVGRRICAFPARAANGTVSIPASQFPAGICFMVLTDGKEHVASAKFAFAR
jgi:hypothetical protein